jgi:hypothetical protein
MPSSDGESPNGGDEVLTLTKVPRRMTWLLTRNTSWPHMVHPPTL